MSDILQNIISLGRTVAPLLEKVAGTTLLGPALVIAENVLDLGHKFKEINQNDDPAELDAMLAEVEQRVAAHADATIESLD